MTYWTPAPGARCKVMTSADAPVSASWQAGSATLHHLAQDTIVVCAEIRPDDGGGNRVRISSPAGWVDGSVLGEAGPVPSLIKDYEAFQQRHETLAAGDYYGLEFPFTLEMLRASGGEFLTKAFHASGVMSKDNSVTAILELKLVEVMGASANALLTVEYAKPDDSLSTALFVKMPPADVGRKFALGPMSHGEVEIARLSSSGTVPVEMARYYFADFSTHTNNYILITDQVKFGISPIEPAYHKGYDHLVPEAAEHYHVLTKALAKLVAAHKTGAMGHDLETMFPFARAARDFWPIASPDVKIDRLIDFIGRIAPHLFLAEARDPAFLQQWRDDLIFGLEHKDAIITFLHADIDYTGLCHPNLNLDNAWYWRDTSGELQVGLLDWGGAGQMSIAQALSGMLMMPEPEIYSQLVKDTISTFVSEYAQQGGVKLDPDRLMFHYKASLFSTAIWIIVDIITDMMFEFSEVEYASMQDRNDIRLMQSGKRSAIIWIDNMLRDWLDDLTPGDACRQIVAVTTQLQNDPQLERI